MTIVFNGTQEHFSARHGRTDFIFTRGVPQDVPDELGARLLRVNAAFAVGAAEAPGNTEGHGAEAAPDSAGAAEGAEAVGADAPEAAPVPRRRRNRAGRA